MYQNGDSHGNWERGGLTIGVRGRERVREGQSHSRLSTCHKTVLTQFKCVFLVINLPLVVNEACFFSGRTLRTTTVAQALEECGKIPPPLAVEGMLPANATTTSGLRQRRLRGLELPSITNHQTLIPRSSVTAGQAHQQPLLSLISLTIRWVIKVTRKLSGHKGLKAHAVEWSVVLVK